MSHLTPLFRRITNNAGASQPRYITDVMNDIRTVDELSSAASYEVLTLPAASAWYNIAFLFVDQVQPGSAMHDLISTQRGSMPRTPTFVILGDNVTRNDWPRSRVDTVRVHRVINRSENGSYVCDDEKDTYTSLGDLIYTHIGSMWSSWKLAHDLEVNMQTVSSHTSRLTDTVTQKMLYPFDTRSKAELATLLIVDAQNKFKSHAFVAETTELYSLTCKVGPVPESGHNTILALYVVPFTSVNTLNTDIRNHDQAARNYGMDVFTLILIQPSNISHYELAFGCIASRTNCAIASSDELSTINWLTYATTAIGAVRMNRYRQRYGAVNDADYKKAVMATSSLLKESKLSSESMLKLLDE